MTQLYGRRRLANIPFGRWKIMTFIAGMCLEHPAPPPHKVSGVTKIIAKPTG
jgi:hypothetical protein